MASIADLTVNLALQTAAFEASAKQTRTTLKNLTGGFNEVKESVEGLKKIAEAFGVSLGVRELVDFGKEAVATAAHIGELAAQAGLSAKQFQGLEFAAAKSGLGVEAIDTAMAHLTRTIGEAAAGSKTAIDGFNAIGVGVLDANNHIRSSATVFGDVARAIAAIPDPARRATAEVAAFGRAGQALDSFVTEFAAGKESIDQLADAARQAGFSFDDNLIQKANEAQAEIELLTRQAQVFAVTWINEFIKALEGTPNAIDKALSGLQPLADFLNHLIGLENDYAKTHRSLLDMLRGGADPSNPVLRPLTDAEAGLNGGLNPPAGTPSTTDAGGPSHNPAASAASTTSSRLEAVGAIRAEQTALAELITKLQQERTELGLSDTARAEYQAMLAATAAAQKDFDAGLRDSPVLTGEEVAGIKANVDAMNAMKEAAKDMQAEIAADAADAQKAIEEQAKQTKQFTDEINAGVEQIGNEFIDAATGVKSWGEAAKVALGDVLKLVAKLIEQSLFGGGGGGGLGGLLAGLFGFGGGGFSFAGFADGGAVSGGVPITVGERGSETFVPKTDGWIMPHGATIGGGAGAVVINNAYDFRGSSVDRAYVQQAVEQGNKRTYAAVYAAMDRGGPEAKAAGRRRR